MILYNHNGCLVNNTEACYYSLINANGAARPAFSALQTALSSDNGGTDSDGGDMEATEEATQEATEEAASGS
jgi:hypothetical protein